ncbi:hypothetical protein [Nocardioides sp. B-3]|uniref:hypothetical protein n=1 Tax=Nocardioides sp. B-3 TaxID=2895565 RepID=UPI0021533326|nr:hypothetical protein [Nocardioides sp. B-3]UUZ60313.1 hypothetical protein LP418_05140 [Nocardioides sp. B-3]
MNTPGVGAHQATEHRPDDRRHQQREHPLAEREADLSPEDSVAEECSQLSEHVARDREARGGDHTGADHQLHECAGPDDAERAERDLLPSTEELACVDHVQSSGR